MMTVAKTFLACIVIAGVVLTGCKHSKNETPLPPGLSQSVKDLEKQVRRTPDDPEAHYKLGNAYYDLGQFAEAKAEYDMTIAKAPNHAKALCNRGLCLRRMGNLDGAIQDYQAALNLDAKDTVTLRNLAMAQKDKGDFEGALRTFDLLSTLEPNDKAVLGDYALGLMSRDRFEEAIQVLKRLNSLDPGDPDNYYYLGECHYALNDFANAINAWTTAVVYDPRHAGANKGLAMAHYQKKDFKRAWAATAKCQSLGLVLDPEFIRNLQQESGQAGPN